MGVKERREDIVVASLLVHSLTPTRGANFAGRAKSVSIKKHSTTYFNPQPANGLHMAPHRAFLAKLVDIAYLLYVSVYSDAQGY